ncbi:hypothetical protein LB506_000856 [Fusarium annulatum]|nr:hypothetical protein LB506_000856 [Fusarium annulatum]
MFGISSQLERRNGKAWRGISMVCSAAVVNVGVVVHDEQLRSQHCRLFLKFHRIFIQGFSLKESPSMSFVLSRIMFPVARLAMSDSQLLHTYRTYPPVSHHSELTLSLLMSRIRLADDIQVSVMSLAGFPSNNLSSISSARV